MAKVHNENKISDVLINLALTFLILLNSGVTILHAQRDSDAQPKLIIGIVVDQMRFDHLYKYENRYGDDGFKRLTKNGYSYKNAHYNYIPTVTAAGHASIYTGATPSMHGIIGNSWYDRKEKDYISNVIDYNEQVVGSQENSDFGMSPSRIMTNTFSDQMKLGSNFRSKVISVSLKDRGAVLPGGHTADAAYWHDWQTSPGFFVTSSYYMDTIPIWAAQFNNSGLANRMLDTIWSTLYPIEDYVLSAPDSNGYERVLGGKSGPVFPYDFRQMRIRYRQLGAEYQLLWVLPGGNTLVTEFAKQAVIHEGLGKDEDTDLLAISYSVPDVAGHTFGPQSVELEDIYLRLDQDISNLLKFLDVEIGEDNYTLFLTSDHGAIHVASYLYDNRLPTGLARIDYYQDTLAEYLTAKYGEGAWIENFSGEEIFLDQQLIFKSGIDLPTIQNDIAAFLSSLEGINIALSAYQLRSQNYEYGIRRIIQNGYNPARSGDVLITFNPGFISSSDPNVSITDIKGTTHGSGYAYDTHIPLVWYGKGIPPGYSVRKVNITDIASTICMMLNLQLPSGNQGLPLKELFLHK